MFVSKPYPDTFFHGDMLAIAEAIKKQDGEMILKLGKSSKDIDTVGKKGMTLLAFAVNDDNPVAIKALMSLGANPEIEISDLGSVGYQAMWRKSDKSLIALLENGMNPNIKISSDRTILFDPPKLADSNAMKLLVKYGADVNARDSVGNTPLLNFVSFRHDEALYLLDNGADPYAMDKMGLSVAFSIQQRLDHTKKTAKAYPKMLEIKNKLIEKGIKFPALSPFGERILNGIIYCLNPRGYMQKEQCKQEGANEFIGEQSEASKRQDENILKERYGIEHRF